MIDTDKYEGHLASEGQTWAWSKWMLKNAESTAQHEATAALLNDAPLLLDFIVWVKNTHPHYYHKLTKAYQGAKNNR